MATAISDTQVCDSIAPATAPARRRGPSLSRRVGQNGNVFQHCKTWNPKAPAYGRYWIDTPNGRRRRTVTLGPCRTRTIARQKLRTHIEAEGINKPQIFTTNTAPGLTFREQAEKWLASQAARRRKPVKPSTLSGWRSPLDRWILPHIGSVPLAEVSNSVLRGLVDKMAAGGLAEKTIVNYSQIVKSVVASLVNSEGEPIHPRRWNDDFIGLPVVNEAAQHRPTTTRTEIENLLSNLKPRYGVLIAVLAGTGLRIGEAVGLKVEDLSSDCTLIHVRRGLWRGKEQSPKTLNAIREIDVPEPLAKLLQFYVAGKSGYLFATKSGRPLSPRNVLRVLSDAKYAAGFHAFRRFRTETLRAACMPEDLIRMWLGHAHRSITDLYASGLRHNIERRQEWAKKVGLGFDLGYLGYKKVMEIGAEKVA